MSILTKLYRLLAMNAAILISTKPSLYEKPQESLLEQANQATYQSQYLHASHVDTLTQNSYRKKDPHFRLVDLKIYSGLQDEIYS
jgi:hypothetical protein